MKVIDNIGRFTLGRTGESYIVINNEGEYKNHSHFRTENGARNCIELLEKKLQPKSRYFKEAAKRLVGLQEYDELIECRKEKYINVNKGRVK